MGRSSGSCRAGDSQEMPAAWTCQAAFQLTLIEGFYRESRLLRGSMSVKYFALGAAEASSSETGRSKRGPAAALGAGTSMVGRGSSSYFLSGGNRQGLW